MSEIYGIIYKATNITNDKAYIGQTILSLSERKGRHIADIPRLNTYFSRALKKHGPENFKWEIVSKCYSAEELNNVEIEMIRECNTFKNGYNMTIGGNCLHGEDNPFYNRRHTEESKRRNSEAHMDEKNPNYGKHPSKETKRKMSVKRRGSKNPMHGKHHSKETIKMMSETRMGSNNANAKKYIIITPEGEKIFGCGLTEFCRNYKINYDNMTKVARGKYKQHRGYRCKYL